jgi:hypothetical protein
MREIMKEMMLNIFVILTIILIPIFGSYNSLYSQGYRDSLVAYWSFDDSTARDHSGNNYHGTLMNIPKPIPGVNGLRTAFRFEGRGEFTSQGDHIVLPMIPFNEFQEFTITMWVKEEGFSYHAGEAYIFFGNHNYGWCGIMHHIEARHLPNKLYMCFAVGAIFDVGVNPLLIDYDENNLNKWTYYCLAYQNGTIYAYINGKLVGTLVQPLKIVDNFAGLARHWWKWSTSVETSTRFTGSIDEVKIFKKALTDEEIKQEYNMCGEGDFAFGGFADASNLNLLGDARISDDKIILTQSAKRLQGAAWYNQSVPVNNGFVVDFSFKIDGGNQGTCDPDGSLPGADGLAFVIQNFSPLAFGYTDWGIGYEGIPNSIAVEFDTYLNAWPNYNATDPNGNHIAVQSRGTEANTSIHTPEATLGIAPNIETINPFGQNIYHSRIIYNHKNRLLQVYFGGNKDAMNLAITINDVNLSTLLDLTGGKNAFMGFTASTGDAWETHEILSWSFCPEIDECQDYIPEISSSVGKSFCEGDTAVLSSVKSYKSYKWSNGITSQSINITKEGKYKLQVIDFNDCPGEAEFELLTLPNPKPIIISELIGDSCNVEKAILTVANGYREYQWYEISSDVLLSTTNKLEVTKSGKYRVKIVNEYGCENESDIIEVNLDRAKDALEILSAPPILFIDSTITGDMRCGYVSVRNHSENEIIIDKPFLIGNIVFSLPQSQTPILLKSGEITELLICFHPKTSGYHYDTLYVPDLCSIHRIYISGLAIENEYSSKTRCGTPIIIRKGDSKPQYIIFSEPYPQPANDLITIELSGGFDAEILSEMSCSLYNSLGIRVSSDFLLTPIYSGDSEGSQTLGLLQISTKDVLQGSYFVIINIDSQTRMIPVILQK